MKLKRKLKPKPPCSGKSYSGDGDYDVMGDYLMAYRFLYYCRHISLLSDKAYDDLEKQYKTTNRAGFARISIGSDKEESYPPHIRALAMYLALRNKPKTEEKQHANKKKIIRPEKGGVKRLVRKGKVK